jgi:hypothetical protein
MVRGSPSWEGPGRERAPGGPAGRGVAGRGQGVRGMVRGSPSWEGRGPGGPEGQPGRGMAGAGVGAGGPSCMHYIGSTGRLLINRLD